MRHDRGALDCDQRGRGCPIALRNQSRRHAGIALPPVAGDQGGGASGLTSEASNMHSFAYYKPTTLQEASQLLAADEQSRLLAGGQTLIPTLKNRLASPAALIDLKGLADLDGIRKAGDALIVGALARHDAVATSPIVGEAIPALASLASNIG